MIIGMAELTTKTPKRGLSNQTILSITCIFIGIVIVIIGYVLAYREHQKTPHDQRGPVLVSYYAISAFGLFLIFIFGAMTVFSFLGDPDSG